MIDVATVLNPDRRCDGCLHHRDVKECFDTKCRTDGNLPFIIVDHIDVEEEPALQPNKT
jgi:hypothetical protein